MNTPKMTPWFPPHIKPVYAGEYNASLFCDPVSRRYWNGEYWSAVYNNSDPADFKRWARNCWVPDSEFIEWRGLAKNPEKKP